MKKSTAIAAVAILLGACSTDKATLKGEFAACPDNKVYLETVAASGAISTDSVTTNSDGRFKIKVTLPEGEATLYNLRCSERTVPLILAPRDRVVVKSVPGLLDGYTVSGSKESELVREIKNIMVFGSARLDSMRTVYNQTSSESSRRSITSAYAQEYYNIKRKQIAFIVNHAGSLAAIYALNQRIPGDEILFGGKNDIVYYRMVADSVAAKYPSSPYLTGLRNTIDRYDSTMAFADKINKALEQEPVPFPEISLPDMYGNKQSLTANLGKVILLDFWTTADKNAGFHNAELKKLYEKYGPENLTIYQVSVDTSKPVWVDMVQGQKLPWISVCDFKGASSPAVLLYGVKSVPDNLLFDRHGNMVGRKLYGTNLAVAVEKAMK